MIKPNTMKMGKKTIIADMMIAKISIFSNSMSSFSSELSSLLFFSFNHLKARSILLWKNTLITSFLNFAHSACDGRQQNAQV